MKRLLIMLLSAAVFSGARVQEAPRPQAPSFRAEFLTSLTDVESKLIQLAEAIPAKKYSWRPARGVRSISEVFTHIAGGNYFLLTFAGRPAPADVPENIEEITDKKKVIAELKKSFAAVRAAANDIDESDVEKPVRLFGNNTTQRGVYMTILNHLWEHFGQSVAYARMNGVTPPWSG